MRHLDPPPTAGSSERGFTFLELMAVIGILAVLSTLVVANMDGLMVSTQVSYASRAFGTELQTLHDLAAIQGREMILEVDIDHSTWRVVDIPSPNVVPDPKDREDETWYGDWFVPDAGVHLEEIAFGRSDSVSSGTLRISFDANGEVSPGGFVAYFSHEDLSEDEVISVELTGLTGLVSYHGGRVVPEETREESDF